MMGKALDSFTKMLATSDSRAALLFGKGSALDWFAAEREIARANWQSKGLPSRKDESWKYTSVTSISDSETTSPKALSPFLAEELFKKSRLNIVSSLELVFIDGKYQPALSKNAQTAGVVALPLLEALKLNDAGLLKALSESQAVFSSGEHKGDESTFVSLNTSLVEDPIVLYVSDGKTVVAPIVLTFIHSGSAPSPESLPVVHNRVIGIFGRMSSASVLENYISGESARSLTNAVSDILLQDAAVVTYVRLQNEGAKASHIGTTRFTLARDAKLESLQISLGSVLSRQDLKVRLSGAGAEAQVDGLYLGRGKQHVDNHTAIEHEVADTMSAQLYKGILDDESRAVFNGRIYIAQDAQRANSSQLNNNLLLSRKAEVDTKPELEIFADDVKAGHGATIGRLDPEHLFYLQSRAINHDDAVSILALGFANDVVLRRANSNLQQALTPVISQAVKGLKTGAL